MKQSFVTVVLGYLETLDEFELDVATKNPIERVGKEVDSGKISWEEGLKKCKSSAKLYRLSDAQSRQLKSIVQRNYS
jgi:hypothetical protein